METINKATEAQVKYLHVLYRKLNWDKEMYRSMLLYKYQITSTTELSKDQAIDFITKLQTILEQMDERVSSKQLFLIRKLWTPIDYSHGEDGDVHLLAFVKKFFRKNKLEDLTKKEGITLIKQIGQMTKQAEERKGKTTVLRRKTKCVHCNQLIMWVQLKDERREAFDCDENNNPTDFHKCYGK